MGGADGALGLGHGAILELDVAPRVGRTKKQAGQSDSYYRQTY